jgi:hypothetical protein
MRGSCGMYGKMRNTYTDLIAVPEVYKLFVRQRLK